MMSQGYVKAVSDSRMNLLQFDRLEAVYPTGTKNTPLTDFIHKRFWAPFLADAYRHRTSIGICVFKVTEVVFEFKSEKRTDRVPEALPEGSFDVTPYLDRETGHIRFCISRNDMSMPYEEDIYVLHFIYKKGPSPHTSVIDSDAGILLNDWKALRAYVEREDTLWELYLRPWIYSQRTVMPNNVQHVLESSRSNDLANPEFRPDAGGFNGPPHPQIEFDHKTKVAYVPIGHTLTKNTGDQPSVQLFEHIKHREKEFHRLVDQTMSMSYQNIEADTGGLHSRSEAAVDEARASTTTIVSTIISDLTSAMQLVHAMIHSAKPDDRITVTIPSRSLVTFKNIYEMLDRGLITHVVAAEEAGKISAIHASRMNLVSEKRAVKKRARLLKDEEQEDSEELVL